jgi:hypothetical protein
VYRPCAYHTSQNRSPNKSQTLTSKPENAPGCAHIAQALRTDIPLQSLTLDFNHIGDEGVLSLAEGLRYNKDLTHLSLAYCRIGPRGGSVIGTQIIRESKVKKILLPGNRILSDGLLAIALNLGKSTTVTTLDLCDNSISGDVSVISFLCEVHVPKP